MDSFWMISIVCLLLLILLVCALWRQQKLRHFVNQLRKSFELHGFTFPANNSLSAQLSGLSDSV
ncbi:GGDEF-domain containing protein, partial [Shewanella sp. 0m-11]